MRSVSTAPRDRAPALLTSTTRRPRRRPELGTVLIVAGLVVAGAVLRVILMRQSLFADELSTRWIIARSGSPGDVVSIVHTDAEITPPLYFLLAWAFTRISLAAEWLRMPSLLSGLALIPLVYGVGLRTIGRRAALVGAALTTLSPLLIYYSSEARGYELMVMLVVLSTYALLRGSDEGGWGWWVLYAAASCAAMYTHYTAAFALAAQALWALWARPSARLPVLAANLAAALAFAPWYSGLRGDFDSSTTKILTALQPFTGRFVRLSLEHWAVGDPNTFPTTGLRAVPGLVPLVVLGLSVLGAVAALGQRLWRAVPRPRPSPELVLLVAIALVVPVGELVASAAGTGLLGTRNLASGWPAAALVLAALLVRAGPRLGPVLAGLAVAAFAVGAVRLTSQAVQRPDVDGAIDYIERTAGPRDVVLNGAVWAPVGVPGLVDATLGRQRPVFELGRPDVQYDPFRVLHPPPSPQSVIARARRAARGGRLFFVLQHDVMPHAPVPPGDPTAEDIARAGYHRLAAHRYPGLVDTWVVVYRRG